MTVTTSFLAGMVAALILGAVLYYGAVALNSYVDGRAREVIMDTLKGLPLPDLKPPTKENS